MLKLDRKPSVPDEELGNGPSIYDTKYKAQYEQINKTMLGENPGPYQHQVNQKVYQRPGQPFYPSKVELAEYSRLEPMAESDTMGLPLPRAFGSKKDDRQANRKFVETDFADRNFKMKKSHLKAVATEESLDDWYAQSLGIDYDKYIRQKKMLQQIMQDAKRKK